MIAAAPVENRANPEQPWVEHRVLDRELVASHREAADDERDEPHDRRRRRPSELGPLDHREHETDERHDGENASDRVERSATRSREVGTNSAVSKSSAATIGSVTMNTEPHQKCSSSKPLDDGAECAANSRERGPDRDRLRAFLDRERVEDDRQGCRHDERRSDAHHRAESDELPGSLAWLAANAAAPKITSPTWSAPFRPNRSPSAPRAAATLRTRARRRRRSTAARCRTRRDRVGSSATPRCARSPP